MTERGTTAHNRAYYAVLRDYLASDRGRDTPLSVRLRLALLTSTPLSLAGASEDLVHDLRVQLEALNVLRTSSFRSVRPCRAPSTVASDRAVVAVLAGP